MKREIEVPQHILDINEMQLEIERLQKWVNDLQSEMYVNCVYCGYRYGKEGEVPASMADILKAHVEVCPKHPMSQLKKENEKLKEEIRDLKNYIQGE